MNVFHTVESRLLGTRLRVYIARGSWWGTLDRLGMQKGVVTLTNRMKILFNCTYCSFYLEEEKREMTIPT